MSDLRKNSECKTNERYRKLLNARDKLKRDIRPFSERIKQIDSQLSGLSRGDSRRAKLIEKKHLIESEIGPIRDMQSRNLELIREEESRAQASLGAGWEDLFIQEAKTYLTKEQFDEIGRRAGKRLEKWCEEFVSDDVEP